MLTVNYWPSLLLALRSAALGDAMGILWREGLEPAVLIYRHATPTRQKGICALNMHVSSLAADVKPFTQDLRLSQMLWINKTIGMPVGDRRLTCLKLRHTIVL